MKSVETVFFKSIKSHVPKNIKSAITKDLKLREDLAFDSMKFLTFIMELERKANFNVVKAEEEVNLADIQSVGDLFTLVEKFQK